MSPATHFRCPDNQKIEIPNCLVGCRMEYRCMTKPTLLAISQDRIWTGVPSTTQLINGTMLEFLKITKPYSIDPQDRIWLLHGTLVHNQLERAAKELNLPSEIALTGEERDIFDLLEPDTNGWTLTDYKTWGSYRVARAMGIVEVGKIPDPSGVVYKTSGRWGRAGSPKMVSKFEIHPEQGDNWEAELQLNHYRVMLALRYVNVAKLQVQVLVRDGGLQIATSRGVDRNIYTIPIRIIPDPEVLKYFGDKSTQLLQALAQGYWTEPCNNKECWEGNRCKGYCEVAEYCPKGYLITKKEVED